ncbi:MAG: hypothetical protein AMXMBFR81_22730 [Chthonomonas sp.]
MNVEMSVVVQLIGYALLGLQPFEYSPAQVPGERSGTFEVYGSGTQSGKPIQTYRLQSGDLVVEARDAADLNAPSVTLIEAREGERRFVWIENESRYALQMPNERDSDKPHAWSNETRTILGRTAHRLSGEGWTQWVERETGLVLAEARSQRAWTAERIESRDAATTLADFGFPGRTVLRGPFQPDVLWRMFERRTSNYADDTAAAVRQSKMWQGAWIQALATPERPGYLGSALEEKSVTRTVPKYRPGPPSLDKAGLPEGTEVDIRVEGDTIRCSLRGPNFAPTLLVQAPWIGEGTFAVRYATVDPTGKEFVQHEVHGRPVLLADGTLYMGFGRTAEEAKARIEARVAVSYGESAKLRSDWADPKTGETLTLIQLYPDKADFWPEGFAPKEPLRTVSANGVAWQVAEFDGYRMATHEALGRRVILGASHLSAEELIKLWPAKPE